MVSGLKLFDLNGKTALITGSSQGIGYALAKGLADAGSDIILNGRNTEKLKQSAEAINTKQNIFQLCLMLLIMNRQSDLLINLKKILSQLIF